MKKFLSIKNTQGISVARASFSSDETVIDFVNNNSQNSDNSTNFNSIPISIVLPPPPPKKHLRRQKQNQLLLSSTSLSEPIADGDSLEKIEFDRISSAVEQHIDPSDTISDTIKTPSKRKRFTKILQVFHIKGKKKIMNENQKKNQVEEEEQPNQKSSNKKSSSTFLPAASTPKFQRNKSRTAALVKKFTMSTKRPVPIVSGKGKKTSLIPLRTAASVEQISNATQIVQHNRHVAKTMASTSTSASASVSHHHSMSDMNLVNIDYRQESDIIGNDFNFEFDQMHFGDKQQQQQQQQQQQEHQTTFNSNRQSDCVTDDGGGIGNNFNRDWNTSSNLSIRSGISTLSNSQYGSVRNSTSSEKLQITISGKKRNTNNNNNNVEKMESEPVSHKLKQPQQFNTIVTNEIEQHHHQSPINKMQPATKVVSQKYQPKQQQQQCESLQFPAQAKSQLQSQPEQSSLTTTKLNISHDLTLMNTVGVPQSHPSTPITTANTSLPTYRISRESIKNVAPNSTDITTQSTMQSQQATVNVDDLSISPPTAVVLEPSTDTLSSPSAHSSNLINWKLTQILTSFDGDEEIPVVNINDDDDADELKTKSSLLTEIIEAEQQQRDNNSMNLPERGRRYPGLAASETIKFTHSTTTANVDDLARNQSELSDLAIEISENDGKLINQMDVVPKVIVQESVKNVNNGEDDVAKQSDHDLIQSLTKSNGAKILQDNNNVAIATTSTSSTAENNNSNEIDSIASSSLQQPTLQFERRNMSSSPEKREHLYKILVIGELGTGKTSFIKRYVHQYFSPNYRATIGVDFALKVLNWDQNTIIRLQLWDIAGQERFGNMTRVYYKEAVGAFIVFDVTRSATFDAVIKWKQDLDSKVQLPNGSPIPCILIANKCDQAKQGIVNTPSKMDDYVKEHGFAGWFETSAKLNINIEEAARALVNKILMNDKIINASEIFDAEKFNLDGSSSDRPKKNCSC